MKRAAILGMVLCCLMLGGCSTWLDGSNYSVTPHLEQRNGENDEIIQASDYDSLCSALKDMIDSRTLSGIISVADYEGNSELDMSRAVHYVRELYPMGAYAVSNLQVQFGTKGGSAAFAVEIEYQRLPSEMDQVLPVLGMEGARAAISSTLNRCESVLTMKIIHFDEVDFAQIVEDYAARHPEMVMETPQVAASFYPATGNVRIVELKFTYLTSRDSLRMMQSRVEPLFMSAKTYVSGDTEKHQKFVQMFSFLMKRFDYKVETSITPAYSLLLHGVGDSKAFATVYASMCRSAGLECTHVTGTRDGEPWTWNIIREGEHYYHVDLLRCLQNGYFREMGDEQMQGYVWDYSAYPQCSSPEPVSEPSENN